jgi:hypothetical protein
VSVTDKQIAEWERLAAEANSGPWQGVLLDFGVLEGVAPDATEKERMKTYVAGSIDLGGDRFYAVLCEKPDGLADVCHTGNGPTSAANATFLAAAREAVPALIAELAAWKKGVEDANRISQGHAARSEAAYAAVRFLLDRIQSDADTGYQLGWGCETFRQLCLAEAAHTGKPFEEIEAERRKTFWRHEPRVLELRRELEASRA